MNLFEPNHHARKPDLKSSVDQWQFCSYFYRFGTKQGITLWVIRIFMCWKRLHHLGFLPILRFLGFYFYFIIMFITDFCIFSHWGSREKSAMACVRSAARGLRKRTFSKDLWIGTEIGNSCSFTPTAYKKDCIRRYWYSMFFWNRPAWHFPRGEIPQI